MQTSIRRESKVKRPRFWAAILWCTTVALGATGCGKKGAGAAREGARAVPVAAASVERKDVPVHLNGLGTVVAFQTVTVRSRVDGVLDKIFFKEGQEVHAGDLLAQVDPRAFQVQLRQAEGALARDKALLDNAKRNLVRYTTLRSEQLIAQQQLDDQQASVSQYEGVVRVDQAAVDSAQLQLTYARITAPIDGVTGIRIVDQGNLVRANDPGGLVVIAQVDPISVLFTLPQDDLQRIAVPQGKGALPVEAFSRDGDTLLGEGSLLVIDNQISATTSTLRLKAVFKNPKRLLWPNQFVKTRLLVAVRKGALVIPAGALQRGPKGTFVYVVKQDESAEVRAVEVAGLEGELALIGKGLDQGERVVTEGQGQLKPGSKVQVRGGQSKQGGRQ